MAREPPPPPGEDPLALLSSLDQINSTSFSSESSRLTALASARALVHRLEQPWERMYDIAWVQPAFLACLRTAQDLDIFSHLASATPSTPQSCRELAEKVHADPVLLRRVLRVLVQEGVIAQPKRQRPRPLHAEDDGAAIEAEDSDLDEDDDLYVSTPLSMALASPTGIVTGLDVFYLAGLSQLSRLPAYLASTHYTNPSDGAHPPWKLIEGMPEFDGDRWEWYKTRPKHQEKFNAFLAAIRREGVGWTELYSSSSSSPSAPSSSSSLEKLIAGWDRSSVLLVDVGGGTGEDILDFARALSSTTSPPPQLHPLPPADLILQDLPSLLSSLPPSSPPLLHQPVPNANATYKITCQPHSFLTPNNPSPNAKIYFLHSILHDWTDALAAKILRHVKEAMRPGYSRLIIFDRVVPERANEWDRRTAALDINMMCNFAALERTERQWKGLIERAGLKFLGRRRVAGQADFLEAELEL